MKKIQDLGYFERQQLVARIAQRIAKIEGFEGVLNLESQHPRTQRWIAQAFEAIEEICTFMDERTECL